MPESLSRKENGRYHRWIKEAIEIRKRSLKAMLSIPGVPSWGEADWQQEVWFTRRKTARWITSPLTSADKNASH